MTIDEIKSAIEQKTGIPAALLHGSTETEVYNYARQLAAFAGGIAPRAAAAKNSSDQRTGAEKQTRELFADTFADFGTGTAPRENSLATSVESAISDLHPEYPVLQDGSEPIHPPIQTSTREQFSEFLSNVFSFNPFY